MICKKIKNHILLEKYEFDNQTKPKEKSFSFRFIMKKILYDIMSIIHEIFH